MENDSKAFNWPHVKRDAIDREKTEVNLAAERERCWCQAGVETSCIANMSCGTHNWRCPVGSLKNWLVAQKRT